MNASIVRMPINPEELNDEARKESFQGCEKSIGRTINRRWVKAEAFIAIWDLAKLISEGMSFEKKSRIVLEYDPECGKFAVVTIMEPK